MERWTPPFYGIRTSVVGSLSIQCVCSPMSRQKKRAGDVLGHGLLQSLWDRHWGGLRWRGFRPPALGGWRGDGLVWACAGMVFCGARAIVLEGRVSGVPALMCTLCGVPFGSSGAPLSV